MPESEKSLDVLGIGCTAVDDVLFVAALPGEDGKARVLRRARRFGGLTGAALVAAARLGARCAYAGQFGPDEFSRSARENLSREGIDVSNAPLNGEAAVVRSTIVVAEDTGRRNIFFDCSGNIGAHRTLPEDSVILAARVLFIDHYGVEGTLRAARLARANRIAVVADLEEIDAPGTAEIMELANHLIVPAAFARAFTGASAPETAAAALWRKDRAVVIVTCGSEGCWSVCDGGSPRHHAAFRVKASDTTGCGDVFHGAYAAALARGDELDARIRFASAAAALKARDGEFPRSPEVENFLSKQ
jgi:sugar/nucleoside kinase (ribokinase family)